MSSFITVGAGVRIVAPDGSSSQRATVSLVHDDRATCCDVLLDATGAEEEGVPVARLQALEPFEGQPLSDFSALELKEHGNTLFKLRDYAAAARYYQAGLDAALKHTHLSVGAAVLVAVSPSEYVSGMVSDVHGSAFFDVVLDDDAEESQVPAARLVPLATAAASTAQSKLSGPGEGSEEAAGRGADLLDMQRALYMNLTRCSLQRQPPMPGWACRYGTLAVAVTQHKAAAEAPSSSSSSSKQLADAYFVRSKAFLAASRPQLARKVPQKAILTLKALL